MNRLIFLIMLSLSALTAGARCLSDVQRSGSWYYLYDCDGKKFKTMAVSSVGNVVGWSSTFFVSRSGSWYYLFDADGKRYKTIAASTIGDVIAVAGDTFTSRKGPWIYTFDRNGRKLNTRAAR